MITLKNSTRGFTLIELLVVITIIGILATGATATYTSQIQKARDTTRIGDMQALQSGIEQYYQDKTQYPDASNITASPFSGVIAYIPKLPTDPKTKQICNKGAAAIATACDYLYTVSTDANGILNGEYKISTGFENQGNIDTKAAKDGGALDELNRFEMGLNLTHSKSTLCNRTAQATFAGTLLVLDNTTCAAANGTAIIIAGNP